MLWCILTPKKEKKEKKNGYGVFRLEFKIHYYLQMKPVKMLVFAHLSGKWKKLPKNNKETNHKANNAMQW